MRRHRLTESSAFRSSPGLEWQGGAGMGVAIILLLIAVASVLFHLLSPWWWTPLASNWGYIDDTITLTFWITGAVFSAVVVVMAYCVLRFRHQEGRRAAYRRIQVGEIHQRQVITVALVTTNPFIVVQEITAAIENETISIDFDRFWMMRRMPVNDRHACLVDQSSGKNRLLIRNVISPIGSPMDRNDDKIAWLSSRHDFVSDL